MMLLCASRLTVAQREQALDAGIRGMVPRTRLGAIRQAVEALLRHETFFPGQGHGVLLKITPTPTLAPARISEAPPAVPTFAGSQRVFYCEAVKDGVPPSRGSLLSDPDPLVCPQCDRSYTLHYSNLIRPVMVQLSRMLTTDLIDSEHPRHSTRVTLELTPSNAVN